MSALEIDFVSAACSDFKIDPPNGPRGWFNVIVCIAIPEPNRQSPIARRNGYNRDTRPDSPGSNRCHVSDIERVEIDAVDSAHIDKGQREYRAEAIWPGRSSPCTNCPRKIEQICGRPRIVWIVRGSGACIALWVFPKEPIVLVPVGVSDKGIGHRKEGFGDFTRCGIWKSAFWLV